MSSVGKDGQKMDASQRAGLLPTPSQGGPAGVDEHRAACLEFMREHGARSWTDGPRAQDHLRRCELVYDRWDQDSTLWLPESSPERPEAPASPFADCPPPVLLAPPPAPLSGRGPLRFTSAFESGNLCGAWRAAEGTDLRGCDAMYELVMQPDTFSRGHTQWFFFAAALANVDGEGSPLEVDRPISVRFRLLNFRKDKSLFSSGQRPVVWDVASKTWRYDVCTDVVWEPGPCIKGNATAGAARAEARLKHQSLSFTHIFDPGGDHAEQSIFFAQSQPYTLSFLHAFLDQLQTDPRRASLLERHTLGFSAMGSRVDLVEVTEPDALENEQRMNAEVSQGKGWRRARATLKDLAPKTYRRVQQQRRRPAVIISARQHPGECQSSWMLHGLLEWLTDPEEEQARELRKRYSFHIVPMLNPDGVCLGNNRCCTSGVDPNRQWHDPMSARALEVNSLKAHIEDLPLGCWMALDLHGHSTKRGVFFYGCRYGPDRRFGNHPFDAAPCDLGLLAALAARENEDVHRRYYRSSMPESKETTARCVLFNEGRARWVYTVEASMHAAERSEEVESGSASRPPTVPTSRSTSKTDEEWRVLTPARLRAFGAALGVSIFKLSSLERAPEAEENQGMLAECRDEAAAQECEVESGVGSDSCPSDDNIDTTEPPVQAAQILRTGPRSGSIPRSPSSDGRELRSEGKPDSPFRRRTKGDTEAPGLRRPPRPGGPSHQAAERGRALAESPSAPSTRRRPKRKTAKLESLPAQETERAQDVARISFHGNMDRLYGSPGGALGRDLGGGFTPQARARSMAAPVAEGGRIARTSSCGALTMRGGPLPGAAVSGLLPELPLAAAPLFGGASQAVMCGGGGGALLGPPGSPMSGRPPQCLGSSYFSETGLRSADLTMLRGGSALLHMRSTGNLQF